MGKERNERRLGRKKKRDSKQSKKKKRTMDYHASGSLSATRRSARKPYCSRFAFFVSVVLCFAIGLLQQAIALRNRIVAEMEGHASLLATQSTQHQALQSSSSSSSSSLKTLQEGGSNHSPHAVKRRQLDTTIVPSSITLSLSSAAAATAALAGAMTTTQTTTRAAPQSTFLLAAAPRGPRYAAALWTQLECFANPTKYDNIVVVSPTWAKDVTTQILHKAQQSIPHFATSSTTRENKNSQLSVLFKTNDRYDVGLWCDALHDLGLTNTGNVNGNPNDSFVLSNDSIFALRPFTAILDKLKARNLTLTSLNYSNRDHNYWLESVLRGFSATGLQRFMQHACVPRNHFYFCPHLHSKIKKKRCIVEHFEIAIASLFNRSQIMGLYPSDTPPSKWGTSWVSNQLYWKRVLRKRLNFPAAKTKNPRMITNLTHHPELQLCTKYMDWNFIEHELDYNISMGLLEVPHVMGKARDKSLQK